MNIIVLVKQVPDVRHIPEEAWDREKGVLKRSFLGTVFNPLDIQALSFALAMRKRMRHGRVICLTMGPGQARMMLEEAVARGADEAVLLTDMKFAGADTFATAHALGFAVRKIVAEIFRDERYTIVAGMQSVDGDTAQVPAQVAEDLGMEHIAYAKSFDIAVDGSLRVERMVAHGMETVKPLVFPVLITVADCMAPANRSFHRARIAAGKIIVWDANDVGASPESIGFKGARTWVVRIFSSGTQRIKPCAYPESMEALLDMVAKDFQRGPTAQAVVETPYELGSRVPSYKGEVWVYAEIQDGVLSGVSLELIQKARVLAKSLHQKAAVIVIGERAAYLSSDIFAAGADKAYVVEHPLLKDFRPFPYKKVVSGIVQAYQPQIVLFGATPLGRELAPRVAYAVGAGLTADCTALEIGDHVQGHDIYTAVLMQSRPALGGNIMATVMTRGSCCQMASVRPGVFKQPILDHTRSGEVVRIEPVLDKMDIRLQILAHAPVMHQVKLEQAQVIVSAGRGLGRKDEVGKVLNPLAEALGQWLKVKVEIAGSRMAVEDGFLGHERQVGQTGQTVAPALYIAVGISGAVQHVTGMQSASIVIAINKDPQARIYRNADYGIVGSFEEHVPRLIEAIRKRCL